MMKMLTAKHPDIKAAGYLFPGFTLTSLLTSFDKVESVHSISFLACSLGKIWNIKSIFAEWERPKTSGK